MEQLVLVMGYALMIALLVQAIWATMWPEAIFEFIPELIGPILEKWKLQKLAKPIYDCPICMTPWYGSAIYALLDLGNSFSMGVLVIILAMGFNVMFIKLYTKEYDS